MVQFQPSFPVFNYFYNKMCALRLSVKLVHLNRTFSKTVLNYTANHELSFTRNHIQCNQKCSFGSSLASTWGSLETSKSPAASSLLLSRRSKHSKSKKTSKTEDEEVENEFIELVQDDRTTDQGSKEISINVDSLRMDSVLKSGLKISRSKVEEYFYQSRIRINGEKVLKKSIQVNLGDEVDIVRGFNSKSEQYIDVMRLRIIGVRLPKDEQSKLELKITRDKLLTIENYTKEWSGDDITL